MKFSLDFDQAHATTADRFKSIVVAKSRDVHTESSSRSQDRDGFLKLIELVIDERFAQSNLPLYLP